MMDNSSPPPPSRLLQLPLRTKSPKRLRNAKNLSLNVPSFSQLSSAVAINSPKTATATSFSFNSSSAPQNYNTIVTDNIPTNCNTGSAYSCLPSAGLPTITNPNGDSLQPNSNSYHSAYSFPSNKSSSTTSSSASTSTSSLPNDTTCLKQNTNLQLAASNWKPSKSKDIYINTSIDLAHSSTYSKSEMPETPCNNSIALPISKNPVYCSSSSASSSSSCSPSATSPMSSLSSSSSSSSSASSSSIPKPNPNLSIIIPQSPTANSFPSAYSSNPPLSLTASQSTIQHNLGNTAFSNDPSFADETPLKQYYSAYPDSTPHMGYTKPHSSSSSSASYPPSSKYENGHSSVAPTERVVVVNTLPLGDPNDMEPSCASYPSGPIIICQPNIYLYSEPTREEAGDFDVVINVAKEVKNPFLNTSILSDNTASSFNHEGLMRLETPSNAGIGYLTNDDCPSVSNACISNMNVNNNALPFDLPLQPMNPASTLIAQPTLDSGSSSSSSSTSTLSAHAPLGFANTLPDSATVSSSMVPSIYHPISKDFSASDTVSIHSSISSLSSSSSSSFSTNISIPSSPPSLNSNPDTFIYSPVGNSIILSSPKPTDSSRTLDSWSHLLPDATDESMKMLSETRTETPSESTFTGLDTDVDGIPSRLGGFENLNNTSSKDGPFSTQQASKHIYTTGSSVFKNGKVILPMGPSSSNSNLPTVQPISSFTQDLKSRSASGSRNHHHKVLKQSSRSKLCEQQGDQLSKHHQLSKQDATSMLDNEPCLITSIADSHDDSTKSLGDINSPKKIPSYNESDQITTSTGAVIRKGTHNTPEYIYVPWDHNSPLTPDLEYLTDVIADRTRQGKRILVHCQCGVSRSASLIVAYVMRTEKWGVHQAYQWVKEKSPGISPNMSLIYQLVEWSRILEDKENERNGKQSQRDLDHDMPNDDDDIRDMKSIDHEMEVENGR